MKHKRYIYSFFGAICFIFIAQFSWAEEFNSTISMPPTDEVLPEWVTSHYPPYESGNKTDPFVSFIKVRAHELLQAAKKAKAQRASTPLETVEVNTLKLIGIINNKNTGQTVAMVELPDGKGYLIRRGTIVGLYDGVVKDIGNSTVVVEENVLDVFGEAKKRTINLRLRQEKE